MTDKQCLQNPIFLLQNVAKLDPYRSSLASVVVWFLFQWYILIVLRIYMLQKAFLNNKNAAPLPPKRAGVILHP